VIALRQQLDRIRTWLFGAPATPQAPAEPSEWCLVGNVVEDHAFGESKELRRGSKHFRPGAKVYCLPPQWGDGYEKVVVVGIARRPRRWITVVMPGALITNWRAKVVYKGEVTRRLRAGFEGRNRQWKSREEVESWAELLRRRDPDHTPTAP
jgi:hypothetical protein